MWRTRLEASGPASEVMKVATVDRGTRVVLRAAHRTVPLRTLAPVTLEGSWSVPVMTEALRGAVRGMLEVQTPMGLMSSEAEVDNLLGELRVRLLAQLRPNSRIRLL